MAYLTNYTYSRLCKKLDPNLELDLDKFLEFVYNDKFIFFIFNRIEIKYLFNYKNILENEDKFYAEYYQKISERKDTHNYVFETGGKLNYHLFSDCSFIHKDFVDFHIPPEIKDLGEDVVEKYRYWFKEKRYAELFFQNKLEQRKVVLDYNSKFPKENGVKPLNEGYELIQKLANSSSKEKKSEFDIEKFKDKLEHLKNKFNNEFPCKVTRILSKFDFLLKRGDEEIHEKMTEIFSSQFVSNYGMDKLKQKLSVSRQLKIELIRALIEYFRWSFTFDNKDFNNITLEIFGLKCCGSCKKRDKSQI